MLRALLFSLLISQAQAATPPERLRQLERSLEPRFAEAVLLYQSSQLQAAQQVLAQILSAAPTHRKALELDALIHKTLNEDDAARESYRKIIKLIPSRAAGPYRFELGMIDFRQGKPEPARQQLTLALDSGFNLGASALVLGILDVRENSSSSAATHFEQVISSDARPLIPLARLYLARIAGDTGSSELAIRHLVAAEAESRELSLAPGASPEDLSAKAGARAREALDAFNVSRYFGHVALLSSYDSNVLSVPSSSGIAGIGTASGYGSLKGVLKAALGYSSPPLDRVQLVPSYKASLNLNANATTRSGQFIVHELNLYLNHAPYASTSYGGKIGATGLFQYQADPTTGSGSFGPYSLQGSFGPYFRREVLSHRLLTVEALFEPRRNYLDPAFSPSARKSGQETRIQVGLESTRVNSWWSPSIFWGVEIDSTSGSEYRSRGTHVEIQNSVRLGRALELGTSAQAGLASFPDRPGHARFDHYGTLDASLTLSLTRRTSILLDGQYQLNLSTVPEAFQFSRWLATTGLVVSL
jgi:Tfp pilus assembly protein PilF